MGLKLSLASETIGRGGLATGGAEWFTGALWGGLVFSAHGFDAGWCFESSGKDDGRRDGQGIQSRQQGVTPLSGTSEVGSAEGAANALLCPARSVQGEVAPVSAVVIPQVVVGIQRGGAQ